MGVEHERSLHPRGLRHGSAGGRRSKYNVALDDPSKEARTYNGRRYASKREAGYARELDLRS